LKKIFLPGILFLTGAWACALLSSAPPEPAAPDAATSATAKTADAKENPGALDALLLSDFSYEAGLVRFNHRAHFGTKKDGGRGIACGKCHHDHAEEREFPEQQCVTCHYPSHQGKGPGGKSL
jgi:hypothetical protein